MTVGEAIDLVLLGVSGGKLTQESSVQREEIRALLPAALDKAVLIEMRARRTEARADRPQGLGSSWADGSFMGVYTLTPAEDSSVYRWYVDLPGKVSSLPNSRGVNYVYPEKHPNLPFVLVQHPGVLAGADGVLGNQTYCFAEANGSTTRIWLYNYTGFDCPLIVWAQVTSGLADTDTLPAPAGVEHDVVQALTEHFLRQRGTPADNMKTDSDINEDKQ